MTKHGALNLGGMFLLPVTVVIAAAIATANGVWNAYTGTYVTLFLLNAVITVPAAFFSWLFLRRSVGDGPRLFAIMPTLIPAVLGSVWYLWLAIFPAEVAPGAEYLGVPQYLLLVLPLTLLIVLLARVTGLVPRIS